MKMVEMNARRRDDEGKAQQANLKLVHDREKHQGDMVALAAERENKAQEAGMKLAALQAKQAADSARANDQRAAQQAKNQAAMTKGFPV
jgi:hypothetical protein